MELTSITITSEIRFLITSGNIYKITSANIYKGGNGAVHFNFLVLKIILAKSGKNFPHQQEYD